MSAGCHAMDALLFCMGSDVASVTSQSTHSANEIFKQYQYPTTSVTLLRFVNGAIGKVASVIDCIQPYYFHVHLVGSEGSLLDNKIYSSHLGGLDKSRWSQLSMKLLDSGDVAVHHLRMTGSSCFVQLGGWLLGQFLPNPAAGVENRFNLLARFG